MPLRYQKISPNFYSIVDTEKMPAFTALDGVFVPPGAMTYFAMGYLTPDLNGDGLPDLVISLNRGSQLSGNPGIGSALFLNDGHNSYTNVTAQLQGGVETRLEVTGFAAGNVDSDGPDEFFIVEMGSRITSAGGKLAYYNPGTGAIVNRSDQLPNLVPTNNTSSGASNEARALLGLDIALGDMDGDGDKDAFVLAFASPGNMQPSYLLINDGNGNFTVRTQQALTDWSKIHWGPNPPYDSMYTASLLDANGDGRQDILWGVSTKQNIRTSFVSLNDGQGNFSASNVTMLPAPLYGGTNTNTRDSVVADFNGDGRTDILLAQTREAPFLAGRGLQLLRNDNGSFSDQSARITFTNPRPDGTHSYTSGQKLYLLDFNNDGFIDFMESGEQASGSPAPVNFSIFVNDGIGNFREIPRAEFSGVTYMQDAIAAGSTPMWTDINDDGIVDFIVTDTTYDGTTLRMNHSVLQGATAYSTGPNGIDPAKYGALDFNEDYYLNTNADVVQLIASGQYTTGLAHYLAAGKTQGRAAMAPALTNTITGTSSADILDGGLLRDKITGGAGNDTIKGGGGLDTAVWTKAAANYQLGYSNGALTVKDLTGSDGTDTLLGVETLQFTDRTVITDTTSHASYSALPEPLWQFFVFAFRAAPGVTYMDQMAAAYTSGASVRGIVESFTATSQFAEMYPVSSSHAQLADLMVENVVKDSAPNATKAGAARDIVIALDSGASMAAVVYELMGKLARAPLNGVVWGNTATQFAHEIAVAKYYTDHLSQSTTDMDTLQDILGAVGTTTDTSTDAAIIQLIGTALLSG